MQYVNLGSSGLKVSRLSYGNWVNSKGGQSDVIDDCVKWCYDHGVNFFDTAEIYSMGDGERQLAHAIKKLNVPRDELVIATKLYHGKRVDTVNAQNCNGTSRKHLLEAIDRSLALLEMDYVDIMFLHRFDSSTPMKETLLAIKAMLDTGKVLYWGTSEWQGVRIIQAMHMCDELKMSRPIVEQCQYNMFVREKMEREYSILFDEYKMGTTIWSPLCSGILTGKYNDGIPDGSRFAENENLLVIYDRHFSEDKKEKTVGMLKELQKVADSLECSMAALATAWCLKYDNVSTLIVGASKVEQLEENFKAMELVDKLDSDVLKRIEMILGNAPKIEYDIRTFKPFPLRR